MLDKAKKEVLEQIVCLLKENDVSVKDLQNYMTLQEKLEQKIFQKVILDLHRQCT